MVDDSLNNSAGKIKVLDKHTAELIAAGEVVERPASVVKELMENSIDAGATSITVEITAGGVKLIKITDNGCGIPHVDVPTAFLRHATSKVSTPDDLDRIGTLGFRGEALPSIATVARVELLTSTAGESDATHYIIEGGEEVLYDVGAHPLGTTVMIRDLFYNVPARLKFLKKDVSEGNAVGKVVDFIAISNPGVSVKFIREGKTEINTPGNGDLLAAIYEVFGKQFASTLTEVDYTLNGIRVSGYTNRTAHGRANRTMQMFFLNGRYVKSNTAMAALEQAYRGQVMTGKFPACVLNIEMPFEAVDVNVHPSKIEVRFINEKPIFSAVYYGVRSALAQENPDSRESFNLREDKVSDFGKGEGREKPVMEDVKVFQIASPDKDKEGGALKTPLTADDGKTVIFRDGSDKLPYDPFQVYSLDFVNDLEIPPPYPIDDINASGDLVNIEYEKLKEEKEKKEQADSSSQVIDMGFPSKIRKRLDIDIEFDEEGSPSTAEVTLIGEFLKTYILAQMGDDLYIIDKHAAHERIVYNDLLEDSEMEAQMLLTPTIVNLNRDECDALIPHLEELKKVGYELDAFGGNSVIVRAMPMILDGVDVVATIEEIAGGLVSGKGKDSFTTDKLDWIFASTACRAAIKAGDISSRFELELMAKRVLLDNIKTCPHGRPVCYKISRRDVERQFGRI